LKLASGAKNIRTETCTKQRLRIYEDMKKKKARQECRKAGILNLANGKMSNDITAAIGVI